MAAVTTTPVGGQATQINTSTSQTTLIINTSATVSINLSSDPSTLAPGTDTSSSQTVMELLPLSALTWPAAEACYAISPSGDVANVTSVPGGTNYYGASTVISGGEIDVNIQGTPEVVVQGGQLTDPAGVALQPTGDQLLKSDLGTGAAGAVTINGYSTLTADLQCTSLVVDSDYALATGGYRILCQGTVTVDGTIDNSASGNTPGATGSLVGGGLGSTSSTQGSGNGSAPTPPTNIGGGIGGSIDTTAIGGIPSGTMPVLPTLRTIHDNSLGGGGGGATYVTGNDATAIAGSGGGVIFIVCSTITGSGTVSANGGVGTATSLASGSIGYAAGGGGGIVIIACYTNDFSGTLECNGGEGEEGEYEAEPVISYPGSPGPAFIIEAP
jgi:hypothetical protein